MEFKQHIVNEKPQTPNKASRGNFVGKVISNNVTTNSIDSPFKLLANNFSTPPSRTAKIFNPFDRHLIDRLHLPTFSPSVFAPASNPKTDGNFKWTIDDISKLKPADIDEATIDQHVFDSDPVIESIVQQKIDRFFSEKVIVPSPMSVESKAVPLISGTPSSPSPAKSEPCKLVTDGIAQTVLTLPPILPSHVEEALKPYFTYTENQQQEQRHLTPKIQDKSALYRALFEYNSPLSSSVQSSPVLPTNLSPIPFLPLIVDTDKANYSPCDLSPIASHSNNKETTACRLNFSGRMSVDNDNSMTVPDVARKLPESPSFLIEDDNARFSLHEALSNSSNNWDMEYKHISVANSSSTKSESPDRMDVSHPNTPHSRIFTSQRKRLSHSFKSDNEFEEENRDNGIVRESLLNYNEGISGRLLTKSRLFRDDLTDAGYSTGMGTITSSESNEFSHVFASTPTKSKY